MRDDGEPISRGQLDRLSAEIRGLRETLFVVALFGGVVLINGILAILLIEFFQSIGWWEVQPTGADERASGLAARFGGRSAAQAQPIVDGTGP